jgi:hypothetical protein
MLHTRGVMQTPSVPDSDPRECNSILKTKAIVEQNHKNTVRALQQQQRRTQQAVEELTIIIVVFVVVMPTLKHVWNEIKPLQAVHMWQHMTANHDDTIYSWEQPSAGDQHNATSAFDALQPSLVLSPVHPGPVFDISESVQQQQQQQQPGIQWTRGFVCPRSGEFDEFSQVFYEYYAKETRTCPVWPPAHVSPLGTCPLSPAPPRTPADRKSATTRWSVGWTFFLVITGIWAILTAASRVRAQRGNHNVAGRQINVSFRDIMHMDMAAYNAQVMHCCLYRQSPIAFFHTERFCHQLLWCSHSVCAWLTSLCPPAVK